MFNNNIVIFKHIYDKILEYISSKPHLNKESFNTKDFKKLIDDTNRSEKGVHIYNLSEDKFQYYLTEIYFESYLTQIRKEKPEITIPYRYTFFNSDEIGLKDRETLMKILTVTYGKILDLEDKKIKEIQNKAKVSAIDRVKKFKF